MKTEFLPQQRSFRDWAALRFGLQWAYEGPVPPIAHHGSYGAPNSPEISCWLIRKGEVTLTANHHTITAKAGQWVFVATAPRYQDFSSNIELLSLHIHFSWPGDAPVINQPHSYAFNANEYPVLERLAKPLVNTVKNQFPKAIANLPSSRCTLPAFLQVQNQLPRWIHEYLRVQSKHHIVPTHLDVQDARILQAMTELDRLPLNLKFSEDYLSRKTGLGRSQLNSLFLQECGMTPRRYFERRRLDAACLLLRSTPTSIKEISFNLGFLHNSHFTQWFRKHTKSSPTSYRNKDVH